MEPTSLRRVQMALTDPLLPDTNVRFWDGQLIKVDLLGAAAQSQRVLHHRVEFLDASQELDGQLS
jgi:hypothetical protein